MTFRYLKWQVLSGFAALTIFCSTPHALQAQSANEVGKAGLDALNAGDYPTAITNFEKFTKDFADSPNIDVVRYSLGLAYLYSGNNAKAAEMLEKVANSTSKDLEPLKAEILFFIAQSYLAQAFALEDGAPKKALLDKTITNINTLLTKFPNSDRKNEALMTRAKIYLQAKDFAKAQADLESLKSTDNPDIKTETDYFLGYTYAQQASALLDDFKKEEAAEMIQKARDTYKILAQSSNFAIANDAAFQLANLDFADRKFDEARAGFRALRSKKEILANVQARVDKLRAEIQATADANRKQALNRQLQAAQQKLVDVKANPELAVQAMIRVADTYLAEKAYNEARVVLRHVEPYADENQKKVIAINVIITLALQGKADKAKEASAAFEAKFPKDPMGETIDFVIGQALAQQGRYDEALQSLDRSLKNFPNSRVVNQIPLVTVTIYISQGKPDEAIKSLDKTIADAEKGTLKLSPESIDQAKRLRAMTLFDMKKTDEAVAAMKALQASTKSETVRQDATYQIANMLYKSAKLEEAMQALKDYIAKYPTDPNAATAQFQIILGYIKLSKPDEAIASAKEFLTKYPDNPQAVRAHEQIWGIYKAQKKTEEMIAAQDAMATAFPDSEFLIPAYFQRGAALQEQKKMEDAKAAYEKALAQYKKLAAANSPGVQNKAIRSNAAFAMLRLASIDQKIAADLGAVATLDETQKKQWLEQMNKAQAQLVETIKVFPDSATPNALKALSEISKLKVNGGLAQKSDVLIQFSQVAGSVQDPSVRLQVNMAQAALAYDLALTTQSLELYEKAINDPNAKPAWTDLERYGNALQSAKQYDKAFKVFERVSKEFASDPKAEAAALYGMGAALQEQGKITDAGTYFKTLKEKYPKSPKVIDAEYGNGLAAAAEGKYEEAFTIWREVLKNGQASNEAKAKSMLAYGKTLEAAAAANKVPESETKQADPKLPPLTGLDVAVNYYKRLDNYFEAQQEICAEGLYRAVQILKKQNKPDDAAKLVQIINTKYPTTSWAAKVREGN